MLEVLYRHSGNFAHFGERLLPCARDDVVDLVSALLAGDADHDALVEGAQLPDVRVVLALLDQGAYVAVATIDVEVKLVLWSSGGTKGQGYEDGRM